GIESRPAGAAGFITIPFGGLSVTTAVPGNPTSIPGAGGGSRPRKDLVPPVILPPPSIEPPGTNPADPPTSHPGHGEDPPGGRTERPPQNGGPVFTSAAGDYEML